MRSFEKCFGVVLALVSSAAAVQPECIPVGDWRYTTLAPKEGWTRADYSDAVWAAGEPGFGNHGLPPLQQSLVRTAWTTSDIWARAAFELKDVSSCRKGWVHVRKVTLAYRQFIIWADAKELDRLRRLHKHRRGVPGVPYPSELTTPKP